MTASIICKVTAVLLLGIAALQLSSRLPAAVRHLVCSCAVFATLVVPMLVRQHTLSSPFRFAISVPSEAVPLARVWNPFPAIWFAGIVFVLVRFGIGVAYLHWKTRQAEGDGEIRIASVDSPLVWGWLQPTILMPRGARSWTREHWAMAIAHERAHVARRDLWTSTLAALAEAVYWFHPLIWWMTLRMRQEQELACDEKLLEEGCDGIAYAELLVHTAGLPESGLLGCRMTGGTMKKRLERILRWQKAYSWSPAKRTITTLVCALCLGFGALIAPAIADDVYKIGGDVSSPRLIEKHEPQYTKDARDAKVQGTVVLSLIITKEGEPADVQVLRSLDAGLDQKAVEAVSSWRFEPAQKDGKPVAVRANVEVSFRLVDDPKKK